MILLVSPENKHLYSDKIHQYCRIRKLVFYDTLGWDVTVDGDIEIDRYDYMPCTYVLSLDQNGDVVGGLRQMPMSGPTLTWENSRI